MNPQIKKLSALASHVFWKKKFKNQKAVINMCVQGTNKFLIEAVRNKLGNSEVNVNGIRNVIGMLTSSLFNSFFEIKKFVV